MLCWVTVWENGAILPWYRIPQGSSSFFFRCKWFMWIIMIRKNMQQFNSYFFLLLFKGVVDDFFLYGFMNQARAKSYCGGRSGFKWSRSGLPRRQAFVSACCYSCGGQCCKQQLCASCPIKLNYKSAWGREGLPEAVSWSISQEHCLLPRKCFSATYVLEVILEGF